MASGEGAVLLNATKWLNGVTIYTESQTVLDNILALPYVADVLKLVGGNAYEKDFFKNEFHLTLPVLIARVHSI